MSSRTRRTIVRIVAFACGWGLLVGPWPAVDTPYTATMAFRDTIHRLTVSPGKGGTGPLRAGVAEVDLVPAAPVPLAGFIGQVLQPYEGINSSCAAKALTVAGSGVDLTILAADLLLIDAKLAGAVVARTGLARHQIYFTATHTHSGPGGWGNHPLERLVAGSFRPEVFDLLAERLAGVVLASRARLRPVEVAFVQTQVGPIQQNRIEPGSPTNDTLSAWIFRSVRPNAKPLVLATLATFGAHATITHPNPPRLGGDYPGAFATALPRLVDAGVVLFAAGTVGDASPIRIKAPNQQKSAEAYGLILATSLAGQFSTAEYRADVPFGNLGLEVDLPPVQMPLLAATLRFSPLFTWWVSGRRTYLHTVRLGPALLVGFPGDYAGHLAARLHADLPVVATSFNGDYKGYLVSRSTFWSPAAQSSYETRWMSFFGPDLGEYLNDLAQRCCHQLMIPAA